MNDEVEWLRKAFAEVQPEDSQDFDPEELWDAAQGKADAETRLKWIDRMSYDPEAVEIWRMAKQLQDELPTEDPEVGTVASSMSERDTPDNVVPLFPRAALWAAPVSKDSNTRALFENCRVVRPSPPSRVGDEAPHKPSSALTRMIASKSGRLIQSTERTASRADAWFASLTSLGDSYAHLGYQVCFIQRHRFRGEYT